MDKPDLIVACVVADGEAETGPTATAWHGYKFIDPAESGAALPILHVNGFKISERTISGCMDDLEMATNSKPTSSIHTGRNFQWDQYSNAQGGRVAETLSEHQCQGMYRVLS
jgi:phosphoketolase